MRIFILHHKAKMASAVTAVFAYVTRLFVRCVLQSAFSIAWTFSQHAIAGHTLLEVVLESVSR